MNIESLPLIGLVVAAVKGFDRSRILDGIIVAVLASFISAAASTTIMVYVLKEQIRGIELLVTNKIENNTKTIDKVENRLDRLELRQQILADKVGGK